MLCEGRGDRNGDQAGPSLDNHGGDRRHGAGAWGDVVAENECTAFVAEPPPFLGIQRDVWVRRTTRCHRTNRVADTRVV